MKVTQIAVDAEGVVFGLGIDNKIYRWVASKAEWMLVGPTTGLARVIENE